MAEKIVSPGVFTNERDLSFLPQGIAQIGAAFIGPTVKGPAFIPTQVGSYGDFVQIFGDTNPNMYLPYTAKEYLNNGGNLTVVRVLHDDGYQVNTPLAVVASGSFGRRYIATLFPTQNVTSDFVIGAAEENFEKSTLTSNVSGSAVIKLSGSYTPTNFEISTFSASLASTNANYFTKVFSQVPTVNKSAAYLYTFFAKAASASLASDPNCRLELFSGSYVSETTYSEAVTPYIISQTVNGTNTNLFKIHTIADGYHTNYEIKIGISDIKAAGNVPGSEYGSFTVTVRAVDQTYLRILGSPYSYTDSDARPNILEVFDNVNLDPNSSRYIARVIGDQYKEFSGGKVLVRGNYRNLSKYIYVEMDSAVESGAISNNLVPFGFAALNNPVSDSHITSTFVPSASFVTAQTINGVYNKRKFHGFNYDFSGTDNANYLKPLPGTATTGSNANFLLSNCNQQAAANYPASAPYSGSIDLSSNTSPDSRKFMVPFQGGFDGAEPFKKALVGSEIVTSNTQGYDLTGITGKDYSVYTNAIDAVSNPDEIDINMLVLPGVIQEHHSAIIDYAYNMCTDRSDVFMVFDTVGLTAGVTAAVDAVSTIDNNYSATYYPWVKILDTIINKPVWVPPSVVLPGVLAFNDRVAAEWYAPAGLNRGGLTSVIDAYTRLTHAERDELYEGRVNPIATFPGQGVCVWGQKTLQAKASALDRINVRRMLIAVKKYIASATKYLVFENNTGATRNRFLNIVNPYLESVQQRQGLYAFKVVMDETNNTPDVIDRNIMYGQIFLQPAKTAEFIIIDFNILPTGAAFPGA
jgi:hypothetical protein